MADKKKCDECKRPERICDTCSRKLCCAGPRGREIRGTCNDCGYPWRSCLSCGEPQRWDEPEHETIDRVVRPTHCFGGALAGTRVKVEPRHVDLPNVQQATMSLEEAAALDQHRREAPLRSAEVPLIVQGLAQAQAAERERMEKQMESGRRRLKREADLAMGEVRSRG